MIKEAIVLAGGLGTRLKDTVPDLPKCMAPVAGRPFLFYVINYLRSQGIIDFIFSLGYKHELIEEYLSRQFPTLSYTCSIESEPLGTGGAIKLAMEQVKADKVIVTNGDTVFKIDVRNFYNDHLLHQTICTLALKPMKQFDRYGSVELDSQGIIQQFHEKRFVEEGLINGGVYIIDKNKFCELSFPLKFSFEQQFLEKNTGNISGYTEDSYFIDIGIPGDFYRAQNEFALPPIDLKKMDQSWTLFIDRDGVINYEKENDYIRNKSEFRFYEDLLSSFNKPAQKFGKIIVISNQRGIGRKLMSEQDLEQIHAHMKAEINAAGGRIDAIYYCTAVDSKDPNRKPNPGMARQAKNDFPGIDFSRSIMVGNKPSDMLFARNAGMYAIYLATTHPETAFPHPDIDLRFENFGDFVKAL